jgi:hypothetical protein
MSAMVSLLLESGKKYTYNATDRKVISGHRAASRCGAGAEKILFHSITKRLFVGKAD